MLSLKFSKHYWKEKSQRDFMMFIFQLFMRSFQILVRTVKLQWRDFEAILFFVVLPILCKLPQTTWTEKPELQTHYRLNRAGVCQLQVDLRGRGLFMSTTSSHICLQPNCCEWRLCPAHPSSFNLTSLPSALQARLQIKKLKNDSRNPKY